MISAEALYRAMAESGVEFVTGVPDSLLKGFCAFVGAALPAERHVVAVNEGAAVAIATGVQLASGGVPLVYLQNSGLGNAVNPLLSLTDPEVYGIPLVLLIGWRGEPGVADEPQHIKQGRVSPALLEAMEVPFEIIDEDPERAERSARAAVARARERSGPAALLVRKGAVGDHAEPAHTAAEPGQLLGREQAIRVVAEALPEAVTVVSTTGKISRELYEHRVQHGQASSKDFLTVGSMGHASQIALGIALTRSDQPVVCLDGDGALLMHMGGLTTIGTSGARNYLHVVVNNGVHDSVGGQPTAGFAIDPPGVARASGYRQVHGPVSDPDDIDGSVRRLLADDGPSFLEVRVRPGARGDLGRPRQSPRQNKDELVGRLRSRQ